MKKKINKEKSVVFSTWCDGLMHLDQKGTFVDNFDYPDSYFEGTLCGIRMGKETPFLNTYGNWYKYFVPERTRVLEEKEKYKPFTYMEQLKKKDLIIGESFFIRSKDNPEYIHLVRITEITLNGEHIACIGLGVSVFSPEELLKNYEYAMSPTKWLPFGVEDE